MSRAFLSRELLGFAALVLVTGCTLLLKLDTTQCTQDKDCDVKGFPGSTCVSGLCQSPSSVTGSTSMQGCTTNKACADANGGFPFFCVTPGEPCVAALSDDCVKAHGKTDSDNALVFAYFEIYKGALEGSGKARTIPAELAVDEVNNIAGGVAGANGVHRPLVLLECDYSVDPVRAAQHVVNDMKVPVIIGLPHGTDFVNVATAVTIPKKVMMVSTYGSSPNLQTLGAKGLTWSVYPNAAFFAPPTAVLGGELETNVRADPNFMATDVKLALIVTKEADGKLVGNAIQSDVHFNSGKDYAMNGMNYLRVDYPDPVANPNPDYQPSVTAALMFKPNIVIIYGASEALTILNLLETQWTASTRPFYVMTNQVRDPAFAFALQGNDSLRKRVFFVDLHPEAGSMAAYNAFVSDYQGATMMAPFPFLTYPYDAVYAASYAAAAVPQNAPSVTGDGMAFGMTKILPGGGGTTVDVGPDALGQVFGNLVSGGAVDLVGASGSLDLDLSTGTPAKDTLVFDIGCFSLDGMMNVTAVSSGQEYVSKTDSLTGMMTACN